jgi:D-glucosaminate-6-phosphate ammonia-lyase
MSNRRSFIRNLSTVPLAGGLAAGGARSAAPVPDYLKELGLRPFINAAGTYTMMTASLMPPEVMAAIQSVSRKFVNLVALNEAVGRRLAAAIGCEAAMVTAGAASALTLGTAACMTGKNQEFIRRLPDTTGMKTEVIVQKSHRYGYEHAVRNCGTRLVEVETAVQLEAAINSNTAMMLFFNANEPVGQISAQQFVELGRKHNVPTFNDAAADVPPVENLSKYTKMGFDLVTFSGGKGMRGPQSTGLLLGRKDLVEAAMLNSSPNSDAIGRGHKVNKEEMVGLMVAVERFMKRDAAAEWKEWERRANVVRKALEPLQGIRTEIWIPEIANHVPHVRVLWDPGTVKLTVAEIQKKMREGEPSIEVMPGGEPLAVGVWMLEPGEAEIVAKRLAQVLRGALAV